jgi:glutathione synthase/RimK-type ligase-like ATP-grasp enzyme/gamma-glutamyl:cysteine ligase YbdK (ATP-grasp superfamily)
VVVSRRDDVAGLPDELVITADAYITGAGTVADSNPRVINLCRTIGYGSDGYYVSLLADARGHDVLPGLERSAGLADSYAVFRALQEAGVATLDAAEMAVRQRDAGCERLVEDALGPLPLVLHDGAWRAPAPDELAEIVVCAGVPDDARFGRLAAQVFDVWPAPLLRLRVVRDDGCWKVAGLAHASPAELDAAQRRVLHDVLVSEPARLDCNAARRDTVRASLAVLTDTADTFSPSSAQTIERLERVAARLHVHVARIGLTDLRRLPEYDALFIRTLTGVTLPAFQFALRAAALDMPVIDDAESIMRCSNKVFLAELLDRERVPVPRTRIVTRRTQWQQLCELGLPFVIKLPDGAFSDAVHRIDSRESYAAHARRLLARSPLLIAQEWLPTTFDWRVTVLDGRVLFAARYHMVRGHWQIRSAENGEERYGRVESVARAAVPGAVADVALRAAAPIGRGMYGVDVKETPRGPVVIEVNDNPNLDAGYEDLADGDVIYEDIVHYFLRRIEEAERVGSPDASTATAAAEPASRPAKRGHARSYGLFEVAGLELEYPTVNADLDVVALVEPAFRAIAGRGTSDIRLDTVAFSNEIADHVFEVKTPEPLTTLREAEDAIVGGVRRFAEVLQQEWDARLLPTGMHPWFDPLHGRLWTRSGLRIYSAYARIFDIRTHGWMNVHATHLNLPFGDERETIALHTAAALLLPYLPAIAASSPMHDGHLQPYADARLAWILQHQARIPQTCGRIVPEPVDSFAAYRRDILRPMYAALDAFPHSEPLRQEFLNARGAVLRFARRALELRVLDTQECVRMDVAIAAFARAALRQLTHDVLDGLVTVPPYDTLVADFEACIRDGTDATVQAPHLRAAADNAPGVSVRTVLGSLVARAQPAVDANDAHYLDLVAAVIRHGSLAQRIRLRLEPHAGTPEALRAAARQVYGELADCLLRNEPWTGRWQAVEPPLEQLAVQPDYAPAPLRTNEAMSASAAASMR